MRALVRSAGAIVRRVIGAPDYDAYLAHMESAPAGCVVLSREEFIASQLRERYERPGSKCC